MNKFGITVIFLIVSIIFFLVCRSIYTQNKYFDLAKHQNGIEAVKSYEKAILFYVPFSHYNKRAINGMLEICRSLLKDDEKLYCYETLRADILQIRSFYTPYGEILNQINPTIATLRAKQMIEWDKSFTEKDFSKLYTYQLNLLTYDNSPSVFWSFIAGLSLLGWISSVIYGIYRNGLIGTVVFLIFFTLWITGLYLA